MAGLAERDGPPDPLPAGRLRRLLRRRTLRYPVPAPIKRAGWLQEILVGPKDVAYTSPEARSMRWYHVNPENVAGDLYAVLSKPISQHQQLLFRARPPFAYETGTPYTGLHSALWAAGQDATGRGGDHPARAPVRAGHRLALACSRRPAT